MRFLLLLLFPLTNLAQSPASLGLKMPGHLNCTSVKDQANSSTCWSFSSVGLIEAELLKKGKGQIDLSEMFIARYSYVRKIERNLALKGTNFFTPGGQFHDVAWVMKHYGMVPEAAYSGRIDGVSPHEHSQLDTAMLHYKNSLLEQQLQKLTPENYRVIDSILDAHLGKVPASFVYHDKTYSPQTFMTNYLEIDPDDYIEITSYTHHPFHSWYVMEDRYNWTADKYYNVPVDEFIAITNNALKAGHSISWDGDVEEPGFNFTMGVAQLAGPVADLQKERQTTLEDSSTLIDHMMLIVAAQKDKAGKTWYLVKNSWGASVNLLSGYLFMSRDYFAIKTGAIIVNKKFITTGKAAVH